MGECKGMKTRRLFAGVKVEATDALRGLVAELKNDLAGERIRWVRPENLHLTVAFFGETAEDEIPRLAAVLAKATEGTPPFEMEIGGLGTFGSPRHPRVVWLGIKSEELVRLYDCVKQELLETGWPPENGEFAPHLTLGRIDRLKDVRRFAEMAGRRREWAAGKQAVKELILFESASGRYMPRASWLLGETKNSE